VYVSMRAFDIHVPMPAAALVLLLVTVATIFPLWPGNVGLVQAAVALPLLQYGVASAHGIAYGFGLQAIEAAVGVGVGLVFLAREGLSYAMLRVMPDAAQAEVPEEQTAGGEDRARESARVPG
jgi:glycosyltransferase 2 family protein